MKLDHEALKTACYGLAQSCMWQRRPIDVVSLEGLALDFEGIASMFIDYLEQMEQDPNIVVRALHYIEHHHAIPRGPGTSWLHEALEVLIELTCPNTKAIQESEQFYRNIEQGIAKARTDYSSSS